MKKLTDEEIQKMLEASLKHEQQAEDEDVRTYRLLFEALSETPEEGLPYQFAERVGKVAYWQRETRQKRRLWIQSALLMVFIVICCVLALIVFPSGATLQLQHILNEGRWPLLFIMLMFTLIQWADYRLVIRRHRKEELDIW
ncbi:MAG: hypothetical protein ACLFUB_05500 [Cyclobacteriaceae bacterium]